MSSDGVCHTDFSLGVSGREQGFSINVSEREQGFSLSVSRNENKVSLSVSRNKNGDFRVTVTSRAPDHYSHPQQFVKHALGCLDYTLVCFTRDIAILKTTGQCTSADVKVPESLCKFVEDFAIQVRPNRRSGDTCRSLFRSL